MWLTHYYHDTDINFQIQLSLPQSANRFSRKSIFRRSCYKIVCGKMKLTLKRDEMELTIVKIKKNMQSRRWLISLLVFIASFYLLRSFLTSCMPVSMGMGMGMMGMHHASPLSFFAFIGALLITWLVWQLFLTPRPKKKVKTIDAKMLKHYQKAGMSDDDIHFFRETMATAKKQIDQLARNMQQTTKLKAINLHFEPVKVSQASFKTIVAQPQKLHAASDFLYRHLPTMVDLTAKYNAISQHEVKDKDTYAVLDKSAEVITQLAQQFRTDYETLVADDLEDINVDMSLAKAAMKKAQADSDVKEQNSNGQDGQGK